MEENDEMEENEAMEALAEALLARSLDDTALPRPLAGIKLGAPSPKNPAGLQNKTVKMTHALSEMAESFCGPQEEEGVLALMVFATTVLAAGLLYEPELLALALSAGRTPLRIELTGEADRW